MGALWTVIAVDANKSLVVSFDFEEAAQETADYLRQFFPQVAIMYNGRASIKIVQGDPNWRKAAEELRALLARPRIA